MIWLFRSNREFIYIYNTQKHPKNTKLQYGCKIRMKNIKEQVGADFFSERTNIQTVTKLSSEISDKWNIKGNIKEI